MSPYTEEGGVNEKAPAPGTLENAPPDNYEARKKRVLDGQTRKNVTRLDRHVCGKVNAVFMLAEKDLRLRADRLYPRCRSMRRQDAAAVRARHYIWFFLHHHPAFEMDLKKIAALTGWDHTTVCYGIQKMRHLLAARPYSVDAALLFELSRELAGALGPMDIFTAAHPKRRGPRK